MNLTKLMLNVFAGCLLPWGAVTSAQQPKPVVVARVVEKEIKSGQRVVGTVHPLKRSTIGSAVDGRVEKFSVDQGQRVAKGQILAQLRTKTLLIEEAAAKAELELAVQSLAELENGSRQEDVAEAEAKMNGAESAWNNAVSRYRRTQELASTDSASLQELEDAKELADAARYAYEASKATYQRIKTGVRKEVIAQSKAQVELQQQKVNLIADRILKYSINAPFDSVVAAEFTEQGAWIKQGDPVVELIQMDKVEIHCPVTAETAVNLTPGTVVRVEFPELPEELLTGKIERIVPSTSSRARTFPVQIKLDNPRRNGRPLLLAGMLARVDFPAGRSEVLPLVPKDALVLNGNQRSVFVVEGDSETGTARRVDVQLGVAFKDLIQVRGNLKVSDRVVVTGNERLTPDSPVKILREVNSTEAEK